MAGHATTAAPRQAAGTAFTMRTKIPAPSATWFQSPNSADQNAPLCRRRCVLAQAGCDEGKARRSQGTLWDMAGSDGQQWRTVPFASLDAAKRSEVRRLARDGQLHPDPVIAASSVAWAYKMRSPRSRLGRIGGLAVSGALGVAGFFVSALDYVPSPGPDVGGWVRQQRLTKRVVRAADATNYEPPDWVHIQEGRGPRMSVADLARQTGFGIEVAQESSDAKHRAGRRHSR